MKKRLVTFLIFSLLAFLPLGVFAQSPFGQEPQGAVSNTGRGEETLSDTPTESQESTAPTSSGAGTQSGVTASGSGGNGLMPGSQNNSGAKPAGVGSYAGNGGGLGGFWQNVLSLFGLGGQNGQNNQSSYKNQETLVTPNAGENPTLFNSQYTAPTPIKTGSTNTTFSCKFNASKTSLGVFLSIATCFVFALIPIMIALLVLWFMFGSIKYINDSEHENRGQYKTFLVWGVLILFVALSFVGILRVMSKTLGI